MKTKWGSCNPAARRTWFNLELAKKPVRCLEYIMVHELLNFRDRHHDEYFTALMDPSFASWRQCREILRKMPLSCCRLSRPAEFWRQC